MTKPCSVYVACPMTGYDKQEMIRQSKMACSILRRYGLVPWSPVLEEKIDGKGLLENSKQTLDWKWEELDKSALNRCFVFLNIRFDEKSFGCEKEGGRHRFSEWQPTVMVSPKHFAGYYSIANYEDDLIVGSIEEAARQIQGRWGTWRKRFVWKLKIFRHAPKWGIRQLIRLTQ